MMSKTTMSDSPPLRNILERHTVMMHWLEIPLALLIGFFMAMAFGWLASDLMQLH